eukprot:6785098-Prymnesium_polylepis.1
MDRACAHATPAAAQGGGAAESGGAGATFGRSGQVDGGLRAPLLGRGQVYPLPLRLQPRTSGI